MKYSKRYIAFTIVLALVFILKFQILGVDNAQVGRFRGGELDTQVWNPMVAKEVNGQTIHAVIDNQTYNNSKSKFYMDKNRNIMVPVSMLRDALNCSAHVYDKKRLLVEKHSQSVSMDVGQKKAYLNGDVVDISSALKEVRGQLVVSLEDLSNLLGYSCSFDIASNTITASDKDTSAIVPASYDLRERDRVSTIYNQGSYGTCWAFAATSALESSLRPEKKVNFSVDHMSMSNSFHANQYDGGEYTMGMAYLAAWQGPVYEKDDPYGDGMTDDSLKAVRHVQEMQVIDGKDYEGIKEAVFKYGGVESSLYSTIRSSQGSSAYYNQNTSAYCYIGTEKPNHDVVIIGWDDNYSRSNFNTPLEGDGAFICQNSWGYTAGTISVTDWTRGSYSALSRAMEYFNKYAGLDENGNQTGPMAGGIVLFAAGNDASSEVCYPAADANAISVGATAFTGAPAYYTNYGTWVRISAPGGDQMLSNAYGGVYSTSVAADGSSGYEGSQGTSMACPHVSGACALAVSYYYGAEKRKGLTGEMLRQALLSSTQSVDRYCTGKYQQYLGNMGIGSLDTYKLLRNIAKIDGIPAQRVGVGDTVSIDLGDHFTATNVLGYTVSVPDLVKIELRGGVMKLTGLKKGRTTIIVSDGAAIRKPIEVTVE